MRQACVHPLAPQLAGLNVSWKWLVHWSISLYVCVLRQLLKQPVKLLCQSTEDSMRITVTSTAVLVWLEIDSHCQVAVFES